MVAAAQAIPEYSHHQHPLQRPSRVRSTVDFNADGKQHGYLIVPHSRNDSAWGCIQVPVTVIRNGHGPTILFTAGSHGDEYEGPIALMKLGRQLEPSAVQGRIILLPAMNLPAVRTATRLSPIDHLNMNRIFPGRRDGTATQLIAHYVYSELLPLAEVVVDLHSGGKTLDFVPSAVMHHLEDRERMWRTLEALRAFGAPLGLVLHELDSEGMLDTVAEEAGKIFISTELGGCGTSTARSVRVAEQGVMNLLRHFGLLEGAPEPAELPTRLMHTPDSDCFVTAEDAGIYEVLAELGDPVENGQPIGQVHFFEQPDRAPAVYRARASGVVYSRHAPGLVQKGDCLAVIAVAYGAEAPAGR